jgi:hypothetical protein
MGKTKSRANAALYRARAKVSTPKQGLADPLSGNPTDLVVTGTEQVAGYPVHTDPQSVNNTYNLYPKDIVKALPREFWHTEVMRGWAKLQSDWFFSGLAYLALVPREGVNESAALAHLNRIQGCWDIGHEEKVAAVAYLLNNWFRAATWKANERRSNLLEDFS